MKKKIIIPIVVLLILCVGVVSFMVISNSNKVVSTITLDINPSVEINLAKNNKVVSVIALNEDAKKIISSNLKGKQLEDTINIITNNIIEKGYAETRELVILVYSSGEVDKSNLQNNIINSFESENIRVEVITVDNITEEDKELAKKYNITPAKANYISSIVEETNIDIEELITKPVNELKETQQSGNYCDDGYILEGPNCLKEIERIKATRGEVCPEGYYEYNGICYLERPIEDTGNFFCDGDFRLENDKCIRTIEDRAIPAKFECSKGDALTRVEAGLTEKENGDANDIVCVDYSKATHPVTPCELPANDPTERTKVGGKCYWHRAPVISTGCPGKIKVNGFCWDDATNVYICAGYRDGKQYKSKSEYCEHSIKYYDPTVTEYKCLDDFKLNGGNKCYKDEINDAFHEYACPDGFSLVNNDRCIDYNNTKPKERGLVCDGDNTRLKGNECIIYEIIEAKHN